MEDIEKTNWWAYMDEPMRDLIRESIDLLKIDNNYHDYGFVVFPAAKAFEGFLKSFFTIWKLLPSNNIRAIVLELAKPSILIYPNVTSMTGFLTS